MIQIIEQTDEEKFKMYNKLSKKDLINMLIESNKHLNSRPLRYTNQTTVGDLCSCNPLNGGSGMCGCTIANNLVDQPSYEYKTDFIFNKTQIT